MAKVRSRKSSGGELAIGRMGGRVEGRSRKSLGRDRAKMNKIVETAIYRVLTQEKEQMGDLENLGGERADRRSIGG